MSDLYFEKKVINWRMIKRYMFILLFTVIVFYGISSVTTFVKKIMGGFMCMVWGWYTAHLVIGSDNKGLTKKVEVPIKKRGKK